MTDLVISDADNIFGMRCPEDGRGVGFSESRSNEPTPHKSVDYRAFKRGFQASRKQSQSLHIALIK